MNLAAYAAGDGRFADHFHPHEARAESVVVDVEHILDRRDTVNCGLPLAHVIQPYQANIHQEILILRLEVRVDFLKQFSRQALFRCDSNLHFRISLHGFDGRTGCAHHMLVRHDVIGVAVLDDATGRRDFLHALCVTVQNRDARRQQVSRDDLSGIYFEIVCIELLARLDDTDRHGAAIGKKERLRNNIAGILLR